MPLDIQISKLPIPTLIVTLSGIKTNPKLHIVNTIAKRFGLELLTILGDHYITNEPTSSEMYRCKICFSMEKMNPVVDDFCNQYLHWKRVMIATFPKLADHFGSAEKRARIKQELHEIENTLEKQRLLAPYLLFCSDKYITQLEQRAISLEQELYPDDANYLSIVI